MSTSINTNIASLNAQRNLSTSALSLTTSMQRLSSGLRVNSAKDDAAGLAIAERMDTQTRGMNVAIRNSNDAISMAQTAEGALGAITNNLQRMRELAVQAANGTNTANDIASLDQEYVLLKQENDRVIASTAFNNVPLLSVAVAAQFQVGANTADVITVNAGQATQAATTLGASNLTASAELAILDTDINTMTSIRATWGASQNRFEQVIANLRVAAENSAASRGRIMDADYAKETANLSRAQILQQAGTAMVAQANQMPQGVLALLRQ
jgi:flagellin